MDGSRPVAALSFTRTKDHIEVRIKDPLADSERYRREFAAHGMDIKLIMVPASPSVRHLPRGRRRPAQ